MPNEDPLNTLTIPGLCFESLIVLDTCISHICMLVDHFGFRPTAPRWHDFSDERPGDRLPGNLGWWTNWRAAGGLDETEAEAFSGALLRAVEWVENNHGGLPRDFDRTRGWDLDRLEHWTTFSFSRDIMRRVADFSGRGRFECLFPFAPDWDVFIRPSVINDGSCHWVSTKDPVREVPIQISLRKRVPLHEQSTGHANV